jgi:hypothetical protein
MVILRNIQRHRDLRANHGCHGGGTQTSYISLAQTSIPSPLGFQFGDQLWSVPRCRKYGNGSWSVECRSVSCSLFQLLRGNPFVNKISIGGVSELVPPLPGNIGSKVTGGLSKHGGFEGNLLTSSLSPWGLTPLFLFFSAPRRCLNHARRRAHWRQPQFPGHPLRSRA